MSDEKAIISKEETFDKLEICLGRLFHARSRKGHKEKKEKDN